MSAGCVRWMLSHAVRTVSGGSPVYRAPVLRFTICSERYDIAASWRWAAFSTEVDSTEQTAAPKKKKKDSRSASVTSVGRKIPHRHIQVISAAGENLGLMHRADVIKVMDEEGLKLVLLNENKDPPVYQLMGGKQIHEKQVKMWEKKKEKAGMCWLVFFVCLFFFYNLCLLISFVPPARNQEIYLSALCRCRSQDC